MSEAPIVLVGTAEALAYLVSAVHRIEDRIMALDAALVRMQAAIAELASDISAANQRVTARLTAMQTTLDQFVADDTTEDAAFNATIADLQAQLAAALADNAGVASQIDSLTASVTAASTAVEGIAPSPGV